MNHKANFAIQIARTLASIGLMAVAACTSLFAPDFPASELIGFPPPPYYQLWWSQVEQCAGRTADFNKIRFYRAAGSSLVVDGKAYGGMFWPDGDKIALLDPWNASVVRHEMLHAILGGGAVHPPEYFAKKCEGVVAFEGGEVFGNPLGTQFVPRANARDVLKLTLSTFPVEPSVSENGGQFSYVVLATNFTSKPAWIAVTDRDIGGFLNVDEGFGGGHFVSYDSIYFAPHQQRRIVIDAFVQSTGDIHVQGEYAGAASPVVTIHIRD